MGHIAGAFRLMLLTNEVNTLQAKLTNLTQIKSDLSDEVASISSQISNLDADDDTVKQLQAKKAKFEAMEKRIDSQMKIYETKISQASTELKSVEQMVAQGIQTATPKYCGIIGQ